MTVPKLGLIVAEPAALGAARSEVSVQLVVLRATLLDMPRTAPARALAERLSAAWPGAERVPYAWHLVTHALDDALAQRGGRPAPPGDPRGFGHLADSPEVEAAWDATLRVVRALGSSHAVLRTPPTFAPGARGRRRLERFVERRRSDGVQLVWEPEGLWEPAELDPLARELGLALMTPIAWDLTPNDRDWLVVGGAGSPAELRSDDVELLCESLLESGADEPVVLFAGPLALRNMRRFRKAWTAD